MSSIPNCSFIDIHSHVLYGLDDGAQTVEQSIAMLEMASAGGTTDIVATPHSDLTYDYQPELIKERLAELREALNGRIRIHQGCDFHLHYDNIQDCLANPDKYTINHQRYLMVEFADSHIPKTTEEVFDCMLRKEITPVITHPERNPILQQRLDDIAKWVMSGCLVQVTAMSFLDRFGKRARRTANELMERKLVHFVASDAHDTERRPPLLGEAYAYVARHYGDVVAGALFRENPKATLTGSYIEIEDPAPKPKRRWLW